MYILQTVLHKFPKVLIRRTYVKNQELLWLVIISFIPVVLMCDSWSGVVFKEKLDVSHS